MSQWLKAISRFTDEQKDVYEKIVEGINGKGKYSAIIKGPAGTGKTLILAQVALQLRGKRGVMFVYTNSLRNFLVSALRNTGAPFTEMQTEMQTFYKWLFGVYRKNFGRYYPEGEFKVKTDEMIDKLMPVVKADIFDFLLIDEGQDFSPKVIQFLIKVSKNIVFVGDANQSIFEIHEDDLSDLTNIVNPNEVHNLILSIRISPSILRFMRKYVFKIYPKLKTVKRDGSKDSKPLVYHSCDLNDFLTYFIPNVGVNYLKADKNLVVVCRHNDDVISVYKKIKSITEQDYVKRITTEPDQDIEFSENLIYCVTMHSCKGLEFDNLLFLNVNNEPTNGLKLHNNLAYTAYTRSREDLIIYSPDKKIPLFSYLDFDFATEITSLPSEDENDDTDMGELI